MFKETVEVVDLNPQTVTVKFTKRAMCGCCRYSGLCSKGDEAVTIDNDKDLSLQKGDKIEVALEEKKSLLSAALMFLLPAMIFIITLIIAYNKIASAALSFLLATAALVVYYVVLKYFLAKRADYFKVRIIGKI